jgi:hypothetical protein
MRSAYYRRNNSYSRSYNAERAEQENRLPRTRAAAHLGVSVKMFDAACDAAGISTSEWHHVGKYANRVDYWDTEECNNSYDFWKFVYQKSKGAKKEVAKQRVKRLIHDQLMTKLYDAILDARGRKAATYGRYSAAFKRRVLQFGKSDIWFHRYTDDYFRHNKQFELSTANVKSFIEDRVNNRQHLKRKALAKSYPVKHPFSRENVKKILDYKVRGIIHHNTLAYCGVEDFRVAAAVIIKKHSDLLASGTLAIDYGFERVAIYRP